MSIYISDENREFGSSELTSISGQPTLGARIVLALRLNTWDTPTDTSLRSLSADVTFTGKGGPVLIGRAFSGDGGALYQRQKRGVTTTSLVLDLTFQQLEGLERRRCGGPFSLELRYQGLAFVDGKASNVGGNLTRQVTQDEWIRVLNQVGYRRLVLVEVPVADDQAHPALAKATLELGHATAALHTGRCRDAVGACRVALEALAHALGETPQTYSLQDLLKRNLLLDKAERFGLVRKMLTIVTHPAHHGDPNAAAVEWHYEDAVAVVAQTAAVLAYHSAKLGVPVR
jgi:hypothetical protein